MPEHPGGDERVDRFVTENSSRRASTCVSSRMSGGASASDTGCSGRRPNDPSALEQTAQAFAQRYQGSSWAKKASVWRKAPQTRASKVDPARSVAVQLSVGIENAGPTGVVGHRCVIAFARV